MTVPDLDRLTLLVLCGAFALAMIFGAVARHIRFCTMGAVTDAVQLGDWSRARQCAAAAGSALAGFSLLAFLGLAEPADTLYAVHHLLWLSGLVGGVLFGFGMVLASGCGSKTLIRLGGGNLKALVVVCVMAIAAFATLKGITAVLRVNTVERVSVALPTLAFAPELLAHAFGAEVRWLRLGLGGGLGALLLVLAWVPRGRPAAADLAGAVVIGLLVTAAWWLTGHAGLVEEHPLTLERTLIATNSGHAEALSFATPMAYTLGWLLFFSDANQHMTVGIAAVLGVVAGAALHAAWQRDFRMEGFVGSGDMAHHLAGAVLMGVGGVTAMGCTIGQGLSALSTLSLASFFSIPGIVGGAVLALRYLEWRMDA
ncbi:MAG: YeeE/YedE family protein [Pseudomonadota bacterium]